MKDRHNYLLDFLKFIFALAVVLYHADNVIKLKKPLLGSGNLAVEFFFIVSGCLMAASATRRPKDQDEPLGTDTRRFLLHKIARLFRLEIRMPAAGICDGIFAVGSGHNVSVTAGLRLLEKTRSEDPLSLHCRS